MKTKGLSSILVLDVQATSWADPKEQGFQPNDTVDVGWAFVDVAKRIVLGSPVNAIVRPTRASISALCTEKTGVTEELAASGTLFGEVCELLWDLSGRSTDAWASWGDFDRKQIEKQCSRDRVRYPFGPRHVNVKTFAALTFGWPVEIGLLEALRRMGSPYQGDAQNARWLAWNAAQMLAQCLTVIDRGRGARP